MAERGREVGYIATTQAFFEMSQVWYASRLDEGWDPPTPVEAMDLWARHGFEGEFWELSR